MKRVILAAAAALGAAGPLTLSAASAQTPPDYELRGGPPIDDHARRFQGDGPRDAYREGGPRSDYRDGPRDDYRGDRFDRGGDWRRHRHRHECRSHGDHRDDGRGYGHDDRRGYDRDRDDYRPR